MSAHGRRPTFLILGAAKCGTTSLYHYLAQHPDVYVSEPKEPYFFELEYERGLDYYWATYFRGWSGETAVGEARHRNLYLPYVAPRVRESLPDARLLVMVREPVERAFSHWWHLHSRKIDPLPFREAVEDDLERIRRGILFEGAEGERLWRRNFDRVSGTNDFRTYVDSGYYADQIARYLKLFPEDRLEVVFLEDLEREPRRVTSEVWAFLGVAPDHRLEDVTLENPAMPPVMHTPIGRWATIAYRKFVPAGLRARAGFHARRLVRRPAMDPETRSWLRAHYAPHNRKLEALVGRDLSHWDR